MDWTFADSAPVSPRVDGVQADTIFPQRSGSPQPPHTPSPLLDRTSLPDSASSPEQDLGPPVSLGQRLKDLLGDKVTLITRDQLEGAREQTQAQSLASRKHASSPQSPTAPQGSTPSPPKSPKSPSTPIPPQRSLPLPPVGQVQSSRKSARPSFAALSGARDATPQPPSPIRNLPGFMNEPFDSLEQFTPGPSLGPRIPPLESLHPSPNRWDSRRISRLPPITSLPDPADDSRKPERPAILHMTEDDFVRLREEAMDDFWDQLMAQEAIQPIKCSSKGSPKYGLGWTNYEQAGGLQYTGPNRGIRGHNEQDTMLVSGRHPGVLNDQASVKRLSKAGKPKLPMSIHDQAVRSFRSAAGHQEDWDAIDASLGSATTFPMRMVSEPYNPRVGLYEPRVVFRDNPWIKVFTRGFNHFSIYSTI